MSELILGSCRIQLINAATHWWDAGTFFGVVPKTMWSKHMTPDPLNRLRFAANCCLIETGGHTILIETGIGNRLSEMELSRMNLTAVAELRRTPMDIGNEWTWIIYQLRENIEPTEMTSPKNST